MKMGESRELKASQKKVVSITTYNMSSLVVQLLSKSV